jgi:hypothetical protein
VGDYDYRIPAPNCQFCGGAMFAEWDRGLFTFHTRTGEFLCPEPVEYVPPKPKKDNRKGRVRPKKGNTDG